MNAFQLPTKAGEQRQQKNLDILRNPKTRNRFMNIFERCLRKGKLEVQWYEELFYKEVVTKMAKDIIQQYVEENSDYAINTGSNLRNDLLSLTEDGRG